MRKILVKSIDDAYDYVIQHYSPAGLEALAGKTDSYVVISIQDSHTDGFGITFSENRYCKGALTLLFDDIDHEVKGSELFSDEMAEQIIRFIEKHKDSDNPVDTLLVHCYAGLSRSPAVAAFAADVLGWDKTVYFRRYKPNKYVYNKLKDVYEKISESRKADEENSKG